MAQFEEIIKKLNLIKLPEEGGFYRETFRSPRKYQTEYGERDLEACIYYLVTPEEFSALHRVKCHEIFHFYAGDSVEMLQLFEDGSHKIITIGSDVLNDEKPQVIVEPHIWQGTRLKGDGKWALLGTTTSFAFDFQDFEVEGREFFYKTHPHIKELIDLYSRF
jgi:uncharacterized protein